MTSKKYKWIKCISRGLQRVILLAPVILLSCSHPKEKLEDHLYQCIKETYLSHHIDIDKELNRFEQYLVEKGVLPSGKGQAYYDFFKKVAALNDVPSEIDYYWIDSLCAIPPEQYFSIKCLENIKQEDSVDFVNSKFYQLDKKIKQATKTGISISKVANAIVSVLSPEDFETKYYHTVALLTIANTCNPVGFSEKLPLYDNAINGNVLKIQLTPGDSIYLDNKLVSEDELVQKVTTFIEQNKPDYKLWLKTDKNVSYDFYTKIQDLLSSVIHSERDKEARREYHSGFDKLNGEQKQAVITKYPYNITE